MKPAQLRKIAWGLFIARPFLGLLIFVAPVFTCAAVFLLDTVDANFAAKAGLSLKSYNRIDKALDSIWMTTILIYVLTSPNMGVFKLALLSLFGLRMLGELAFLFTNNRKFFVIFPNYFEWIFWAYLLGVIFPTWQSIFWSIPLLLFTLILKLFFEVYMHWFGGDITLGLLKWK